VDLVAQNTDAVMAGETGDLGQLDGGVDGASRVVGVRQEEDRPTAAGGCLGEGRVQDRKVEPAVAPRGAETTGRPSVLGTWWNGG
jgi:hypothetical protein